jgi:hypothetical protein
MGVAWPSVRTSLGGNTPKEARESNYLFSSMDLLNHIGDINLGIHDFAEFPSVVSFWELKNVVVYGTGGFD